MSSSDIGLTTKWKIYACKAIRPLIANKAKYDQQIELAQAIIHFKRTPSLIPLEQAPASYASFVGLNGKVEAKSHGYNPEYFTAAAEVIRRAEELGYRDILQKRSYADGYEKIKAGEITGVEQPISLARNIVKAYSIELYEDNNRLTSVLREGKEPSKKLNGILSDALSECRVDNLLTEMARQAPEHASPTGPWEFKPRFIHPNSSWALSL